MTTVTNARLAELLAGLAAEESGVRQKALKRAARGAFLWLEEAEEIVRRGGKLTELHGVGPFVAGHLEKAIQGGLPASLESDSLRHDFLTLAEARAILARDPGWQERL